MKRDFAMKILSAKEEKLLSLEERRYYYQSLKDYLLSTEHEKLSKGSLTLCPIINPLVRKSLRIFCGYPIYIDGENVEGLNGIYAYTHQDKFDHVNFVVGNPNHTILLNSAVLAPIYKIVLNINGVIYVDKNSKEDKSKAKLEMMRLLLQDKGITIFPESAWNLSPNKLLLPMYIGMVDMARKTGMPIIPVVQEYSYKNMNDGKEHIDYVRLRYDHPIYVKDSDDLEEKLEEVRTSLATMRWDLYEEKGLFERRNITNFEYINFIMASIRNLQKAGIDLKVEEQGIFGADDTFYQDHYLNAVDYDEFGVMIPKDADSNFDKSLCK